MTEKQRADLFKKWRPIINEWESLDKEDFIFETLLPYLTDQQLSEVDEVI